MTHFGQQHQGSFSCFQVSLPRAHPRQSTRGLGGHLPSPRTLLWLPAAPALGRASGHQPGGIFLLTPRKVCASRAASELATFPSSPFKILYLFIYFLISAISAISSCFHKPGAVLGPEDSPKVVTWAFPAPSLQAAAPGASKRWNPWHCQLSLDHVPLGSCVLLYEQTLGR